MRYPTTHHIIHTPDETNSALCGSDSYMVTQTDDPLAAAVKIEDRGKRLCGNCKRIVRARFGSIKRWDRAA